MVRLPNANVGRKTDRSIVRLRRSGFPQGYAWRIENRKQRDCLGLRVSYFWVQGRPSSIFYFTQWIKKQISNARNLTRNWLNVNIWCSDDQFSCPVAEWYIPVFNFGVIKSQSNVAVSGKPELLAPRKKSWFWFCNTRALRNTKDRRWDHGHLYTGNVAVRSVSSVFSSWLWTMQDSLTLKPTSYSSL